MNLLFIYNSPVIPENGGVQRVTHVLSSYFEAQGHTVCFLSLKTSESQDSRQYFLPDTERCNTSPNRVFLSQFLKKLEIDIIINQDGLNPDTCKMVFNSEHAGVRIISVAHNSIIGAIKHFRYSRQDVFKKKHLAWLLPIFDWSLVNKTLLYLFKKTHKAHFQGVIDNSDKFVLLSEYYKEELEYIIGSFEQEKVCAISNPCTISSSNSSPHEKEKTALYVGRIDYAQKRNDLLLEIWQKIEKSVNDWKLVIVGDGGDFDRMKESCSKKGLKHVEFIGKANPLPYYQKASLFCMTSAFEGFPLTLVEAMTCGVVPFAFDSFASLKTIIDDGKNGVVIPIFEIEGYTSQLIELMKNNALRNELAKNAIFKAKIFSIEIIGQKWLCLFNELKPCQN